MKRYVYNRKEIMLRAWEIVALDDVTFSEALKLAWAEARLQKKRKADEYKKAADEFKQESLDWFHKQFKRKADVFEAA